MDGKTKHTCTVCSKQFNRPDHLRTHMLVHTGERPHKCNQCGKSFTRQHHLKYHTVTHTGEKPYECEVCNKRFPRKDRLQKHLKIHTHTSSCSSSSPPTPASNQILVPTQETVIIPQTTYVLQTDGNAYAHQNNTVLQQSTTHQVNATQYYAK